MQFNPFCSHECSCLCQVNYLRFVRALITVFSRCNKLWLMTNVRYCQYTECMKNSAYVQHIAPLEEQRHNSKSVIFQEKLLKVLKCYNFLWVQRRHNCSPAASFANCVMTLYLLKLHLQTFLSTPVTQKCRISSCDSILLGAQYVRVTVHSKPHDNYTVIRHIIYAGVQIFNALCPAVQKISDLIRRKYFR